MNTFDNVRQSETMEELLGRGHAQSYLTINEIFEVMADSDENVEDFEVLLEILDLLLNKIRWEKSATDQV